MKNQFKKKSNISKTTFNTIKILLTVAVIAVAIMITYFAIKDGWKAIIDWFSSSWACMFGIVLLLGATLCVWVISVYKKVRAVNEE